MRGRTQTVIVITAILMGGSALAAVSQASPSPSPAQAHSQVVTAGSARRATRPDHADWEEIKAAARMRNIGLERHRTAHFRALAGQLGLSELATIHPVAPGRCREALRALYGNLLDLENAEPGENWTPLRRFVAREPSIRACAPRRANPPFFP
jgi:hypothetical protein